MMGLPVLSVSWRPLKPRIRSIQCRIGRITWHWLLESANSPRRIRSDCSILLPEFKIMSGRDFREGFSQKVGSGMLIFQHFVRLLGAAAIAAALGTAMVGAQEVQMSDSIPPQDDKVVATVNGYEIKT